MDSNQLQEDLEDVLQGFDPIGLLHHDPTLAEVAEEICKLLHHGDDQPVVYEQELTFSPVQSTPEHLTLSSDTSNFSLEVATFTNKSENVKSKSKASCEVCGSLAGKHLNYGAVTCNSCRAFFFRSCKNDAYTNFHCFDEADSNNNNLCKIDSVSRKSCKKCRFIRCQQLGMKVKGKSGAEAGESAPSYIAGEDLRIALTLTDKLTNDERAFIRSMVVKRIDNKIEHRAKFFMCDPEYFKMKLNQTYHCKAISLKYFKLFEDFLVFGKLQTISDGEFSGDGMTKKDRVKLFSTNWPLANEFREAYRIEMGRLKDFDPFKNIDRLLNDLNLKDKDHYYDIYKDVTQHGTIKSKNLRYESTYNFEEMGIESPQQQQRHKQLVDKIAGLSLSQPDPVMPMLITSLIIYSPDFIDLDHPEVAEKIQLHFATLLHRYLKSKNTPRRETIFRECMMVTHYVRELRGFREAGYKKKMCQRKS